MTRTPVGSDTAIEIPVSRTVNMKLEVIVIPVADVDRSKRFYGKLDWRLDADLIRGDGSRIVQFTPPGSPCSIQFGTGAASAVPGSAPRLYLVVSDIEAARAELINRGVEVTETFHRGANQGTISGPIRSGGVTPRTPRSTIRTAMAGCCRRSPCGCPGA
jgi:catechol 2,3-dioxygenase-like lactoylglutathione lyase family enzyme